MISAPKVTKPKPLVSVIIPTHNRAQMLARALKSVMAQSYSNIEILIVADCCTDHTRDTVGSFKDKRISFIELNKNVGGAQARNIGMERAEGEYIAFLDDDDEWEPDKLQEQLKIFQNNSDVAIVSTNFQVYNGSGIISTSNIKEKVTINDLYYENLCGSFSFCITKREFVAGLKINPLLKSCQDWDLFLKILQKTDLKCLVFHGSLVKYYVGHGNKITDNHGDAFNSYILFLRNYWQFMNKTQKNYQLYKLNKWKRNLLGLNIGYLYNIKLFVKALKYYKRAGYKKEISKYFLLIPQLFKLKKASFITRTT